MLNRVDKNRIILLSRAEHKGSRAIARELNLNRKTVQRVLRKYADAIAAEDPDEALLQALAETPKYDISGRHPTAITPEMAHEDHRWHPGGQSSQEGDRPSEAMRQRDHHPSRTCR